MLAEQTAADGPPLDELEPVCHAAKRSWRRSRRRARSTSRSRSRATSSALLRHTRADARLALGASPRAGIALCAWPRRGRCCDGRDYVMPDDVKAVAVPVLAHRLILAPEARSSGVTAAEIWPTPSLHTPVPLAAWPPAHADAARPVRARRLGAALYAVGLGLRHRRGVRARRRPRAGRRRVAFAYVRVGARPMSFVRRGVPRRARRGRRPARCASSCAPRRTASSPLRRRARRRACAAGERPARAARAQRRPAARRLRLPGVPRGRYVLDAATRCGSRTRSASSASSGGSTAASVLLVCPRLCDLDGLFSDAGGPGGSARRCWSAACRLRPARRARLPAGRVAAAACTGRRPPAPAADGQGARGLAARRGRRRARHCAAGLTSARRPTRRSRWRCASPASIAHHLLGSGIRTALVTLGDVRERRSVASIGRLARRARPALGRAGRRGSRRSRCRSPRGAASTPRASGS